MTSHNLAVCLSPSLFHSPHVINYSSVSPIRMKKSAHGPDLRDLEDQKATHHCFKFMIDHAPSLFRVGLELNGDFYYKIKNRHFKRHLYNFIHNRFLLSMQCTM